MDYASAWLSKLWKGTGLLAIPPSAMAKPGDGVPSSLSPQGNLFVVLLCVLQGLRNHGRGLDREIFLFAKPSGCLQAPKLLVARQPHPFPALIRDYSRRATETRSYRVTQNPPFPGDVDLLLTRLMLRLLQQPVVLPPSTCPFVSHSHLLSIQCTCLATPPVVTRTMLCSRSSKSWASPISFRTHDL
ncbi:hypothetical protein B0T09DRAFT_29937 [Sordaria sp. MPI-SDFR-AT-0083]|nr:hypothetical protein B0T09DRAFT_29937 [Sordaria sp. MPI-SDFR-AT-0083]